MKIVYVPPGDPSNHRQLRARQDAEKARAEALSLAQEMKALDQTPNDHWSSPDRIMLTDHPRDFGVMGRLFGPRERVTGTAEFEDGELIRLQASVFDARHGEAEDSGARRYYYEKLPDRIRFGAPARVEKWTERVREVKNAAYVYRSQPMTRVAYTVVQETWNGELFVQPEQGHLGYTTDDLTVILSKANWLAD